MKEACKIIYKDAVYIIPTTKQRLKQKEYLQKGEIPVVDQGQDIVGGYTNDKSRIINCKLPVIVFGDHTKAVKLINFKFASGADGTKVLQPKKSIIPAYLSYITEILVFRITDKGYARHYQYIEKEEFPLVSVPEQKAIVAKIEELFSSLDSGIADLKKAQEQLVIYRQAVLKKAFEGELTKEWREKQILKEWKFVELKDVLIHSKEKHKPEKVETLFYIGLEHIEKNSGLLTASVGNEEIITVKNKFCKGQILYGKLRPYLNKVHLASKNGVCSTDILVFTISDDILPKYALNFMLSRGFVNDMSNNTNGVNLPRVSTQYVNSYTTPLPPLKEQHQIVREIESRLSVCDKVEESIAESLEKAKALRQSILKKAFEGKLLSEEEIEKCKQEKDYEPAHKLLERIKGREEEK